MFEVPGSQLTKLSELARHDMLHDIIEAQSAFQKRVGRDFETCSMAERIQSIKDDIIALEDELHEALAETTWKPWVKGEPEINRDKYVGELIDALHFLCNLFLVVGADAHEIHERYFRKNKINHQRQEDGYTGEKCRVCHRELDGLPVLKRGNDRFCSMEHMDVAVQASG
jgi:dimeric dUTPase (all-alpha-NTP-PPase superfamily)